MNKLKECVVLNDLLKTDSGIDEKLCLNLDKDRVELLMNRLLAISMYYTVSPEEILNALTPKTNTKRLVELGILTRCDLVH